jgi:hypothetical protein
VPSFGALGTARDDAMVARWSANPLAMLWTEMDAAFASSGGNGGGPHSDGAAAGGDDRRWLGLNRANKPGAAS